jgi:iron donor protein CyaY
MSTSHKVFALLLIQNLADILEDNDFIVDSNEQILNFRNNQGNYVVHYHYTLNQLWYASTQTGAFHFIYNNDNWYCTKSQQSFHEIITKEFPSLAYIF